MSNNFLFHFVGSGHFVDVRRNYSDQSLQCKTPLSAKQGVIEILKFPLLIQEGLYKVVEVEPFRVVGPEHLPA